MNDEELILGWIAAEEAELIDRWVALGSSTAMTHAPAPRRRPPADVEAAMNRRGFFWNED